MYHRSGFRSGGTCELTLVPVFVPGEHPPKTTLLETTPFVNPRKLRISRVVPWVSLPEIEDAKSPKSPKEKEQLSGNYFRTAFVSEGTSRKNPAGPWAPSPRQWLSVTLHRTWDTPYGSSSATAFVLPAAFIGARALAFKDGFMFFTTALASFFPATRLGDISIY